jgi:hypothetical protein
MKRAGLIGVAAMTALLLPAVWSAEGKKPHVKLSKPSYNPEAESFELFDAMESGKIGVQLIMKNSKEATVLVENKTEKPLNIRLPDAFVGVLAQADDPFGGGGGGAQAGGFGGGGQQGGQGIFNVPAERVGAIKVAGVCLEHGKDEPRPTIKYSLKPVEAFSTDPVLKEMLTLFGQKKINQRVAQAAAWHLSSKMSWQQLSDKKIRRLGGAPPQPYFTPQELAGAMKLVEAAKSVAKDKSTESPQPTSPGTKLSSR